MLDKKIFAKTQTFNPMITFDVIKQTRYVHIVV